MTNALMPCKLETMIYDVVGWDLQRVHAESRLAKAACQPCRSASEDVLESKSSGMAGQQYRLNSEVKIYI